MPTAEPVPVVDRALAVVATGARDVARLVLPVECPGCGRWDELLCDLCAAVLAGPTLRCEDGVPRLDRMDGCAPLPVWRVTDYSGAARGMVVAWKDRGRIDLTPVLVEAVRRGAASIGPQVAGAAAGEPVTVVPVPSSAGATRRRGADLVARLAAAAAEGLALAGVRATARPVLARSRAGRDQVGLGARARRRNAAGSFRVRRSAASLFPGPSDPAREASGVGGLHLLVDDVVTTGSTLAACEDVLVADGRIVLGALVLAATPAPSQVRPRLLSGSGED